MPALAPILVAVAAAASGLQMHRAFGLGPLLVPVVGAATLATLVAWAARRLGRSAGFGALASLVAAILAAGPLVLRDGALGGAAPTGTSLDAFRDGVVNGWDRLITTQLPLDPEPDVLIVPFALVWIAAALGAELVLRTRARLAAGTFAVLTLGVGIAGSVGGSGSRYLPTAVVAAALAALAATTPATRPDDATEPETSVGPSGGLGRVLVSTGAVVLLGVVVGPGVATIIDRTPYDPRETAVPDVEDRRSVNPLALLGAWAQEPGTVLFEARADRPVRWRLAVLDRWDGREWTAAPRFLSVGSRLPAPEGRERTGGERVEQEVTLRDLDTQWLPIADQAVEIRDADVLYDIETGVVLAPQTERATSYRAVSEVIEPAPATYATRPTGDSEVDVPSLPGQMAALADDVVGPEASSPYRRALLIERFLRDELTFDPASTSGHSHQRLLQLLGYPDETAQQRGDPVPGTSEQFATAFALLARSVGLPTRIVVGFHAGHELGGDRYSIRAGDAFAWPEVELAGIGWVALDPTPQSEDTPPPLEEQERQQVEAEAGNTAVVEAPPDPGQPENVRGPAIPKPEVRGESTAWYAIAVATAVLLVAAYLALAVAVPRIHRRRRRHGSARAQIVGAWDEVLDGLAAGGTPSPSSATTLEVAALAAPMLPDTGRVALDGLRQAVLRAIYSDQPIDDADAATAWSRALDIAPGLRARRGRVGRAVRSLHPRRVASIVRAP